jgi:CRISPR-associated endonuclease/helicase Cas3
MDAPVPEGADWAKLLPRRGEPERWHPLVDHCSDVAACAEALMANPVVGSRLAALAGIEVLPQLWAERLAALAFLHDFGKANRKFQGREGGHIKEAAFIVGRPERLRQSGFDALDVFGAPSEFLFSVVLGHHGEPPDIRNPGQDDAAWAVGPDRNPTASVAALIEFARTAWPMAFQPGGDPLPQPESPFWHAYLGLLQLADWLGSDDALDAFPFSQPSDGPRLCFTRTRARLLLDRIGFNASSLREALPHPLTFEAVSHHPPTDITLRLTFSWPRPKLLDPSWCWRLKPGLARPRPRCGGLPRCSRQARSTDCISRCRRGSPPPRCTRGCRRPWVACFPGSSLKPCAHCPVTRWPERRKFAVCLISPCSGATTLTISCDAPDGRPSSPNGFLLRQWRLEPSIRRCSARLVKHAQMRSFCLSRALLVVDEVHASDGYMERLLTALLTQHRAAAGQALLLSATLGAAARTRLLGIRNKKATPARDAAAAVPYPALSWVGRDGVITVAKRSRERTKAVAIKPSLAISDPEAVARIALNAAERGAKVLIVRNLVRDAVATARALHALAPNHPALFRLDGIATLHHGRFARPDRWRLDQEVERAIGIQCPPGPLMLVGTQTLEQSLDIDANLLVTDLAPVDVLLQRIGRLHRHDRKRPPGFEAAQAIVLTPGDFDASLAATIRDRSGPHGLGGIVYTDLVMLAAARAQIGAGARWIIPEMNRSLVEAATHPVTIDALAAQLSKQDARWNEARMRSLGLGIAQGQAAVAAAIDWKSPVPDFRVAEERIGTRLGLGDVEIVLPEPQRGPFTRSEPISRLVIPAHLLSGIDYDAQPVHISARDGGFSLSLNDRVFSYGRYGLERH